MKRLFALLIGLTLAVIFGYLYVKFSAPLEPSALAVPAENPVAKSDGDNTIFFLVVIFSWVTAFLPMPAWLAIVLDLGISWFGLAIFFVTGFFVYMQQPNNTLQDGDYVAFLCSIAMIAPRVIRILRSIAREDIN